MTASTAGRRQKRRRYSTDHEAKDKFRGMQIPARVEANRQRIRTILGKSKMSTIEMAAAVGVCKHTIYNWRAGKGLYTTARLVSLMLEIEKGGER